VDGQEIAAVLLDLSLPDSQGLETSAPWRAARGLPVLVLTGLDDESWRAGRRGRRPWIIW